MGFGLLRDLITDGKKIAATVLAEAVVAGAEVAEDLGKKKQELLEKGLETAGTLIEKRGDLEQKAGKALLDFADVVSRTLGDLVNDPIPMPKSTVSTTPEAKPAFNVPAAPAQPEVKAEVKKAAPKAKKPKAAAPKKAASAKKLSK